MSIKKLEKKYFGTDGVRGVTGVEMTPYLAMKIALSFATTLGYGKTIGLAMDTRTSNSLLSSAVCAGVLASGCNIIDFGILPTPAIQYLIRERNLDGGIIVTASHNPPEYNGIKVVDADGIEMSDDKIIDIEAIMQSEKYIYAPWNKVGIGTVDKTGAETYISAIVKQFPKGCGKGMTVVVDPGNGPATITTPEILRRLGCTVYTINETFDGTFPGRLPEPTAEGLTGLSAHVRRYGADFGVAHDGDADRAIFVDNNGVFMDGNISLALITSYYCAKHSNGIVVTPINTSGGVESISLQHNCTTLYTEVGSVYVAHTMQKMIEESDPVLIGGEGNGGIIYPDHQLCRDGGMSAATMLALLFDQKKPLSALIEELPKYATIQEKRKTHRALEIIAHMKNHFAGLPIDDRDGIKISKGDAWALIRKSGTEPIVRITTESRNPKESQQLMDEILDEIKSYPD